MMFWLIYLLVFILSIVLLCQRYLAWFLSKLLARQFGWKNVKLSGIGLFHVQNLKIVVIDGLTVEIHDLRLSSSFVNQELRKPIMFTASDLRVESELSLIQNASKDNKQQKNSKNFTTERQMRIIQWLQYVGAKIHTSNFVLLDALPGCLLHITFDNLCLETYLEREGLQLELKCKLIQSKLFLRKKIDALLLDISLSGTASVDISEGTGKLKRLCISLGNPRIIVFDGIIEYINNHTPQNLYANPVSQTSKKTPFTQLLKKTPNINFDIDKLSVQFIAFANVEPSRRLSLNLQTLKAAVDTSVQTSSIQFTNCKITDNMAESNFHCAQFVATVVSTTMATPSPNLMASSTVFQMSVNIFTPFIVLYQHDLSWWINYTRGPQILRLFGQKAAFEDDFSQSPIIEDITEDGMTSTDTSITSTMVIDAELTDFQCQLKNSDGSAVVFGIDVATLTADHAINEVEFGVESLWCHHVKGRVINERITLDPAKHTWGTTVCLGAGLAKFAQHQGDRHLCVQLDECQFEWEEEVVTLIVGFIESFRTQRKAVVEEPEATGMANRNSWDSVDTLSWRIQISAKKLQCFFTAKKAAFLAFFVENWRFESSTSASVFSMSVEDIKLLQGELHPDVSFIPSDWGAFLNPEAQKLHRIQPCGGCSKISIRFINNISSREFVIHFESTLELIWSPLAYIVFYEVFSKIREIIKTFTFAHKTKKPASRLLLTIVSDHPVDFGFRLPRSHFMRWVVPSIQFVKVDTVINVSAPTFLLEMDGHLILNLESPRIQRLAIDSRMDMGRQEFRELQNRTNKVWWWHADALQIVFPFQYNFAAAYEEVINSVKWIKLVHKMKSKQFTVDSPLPADLRITFKTAVLQMNDDPFEVQLQTIYEVIMDEVFERERRRQILEETIAELQRENPLFPKSKIDALYQKLAVKDAQIYVDRIRQVQQPTHRQLFLWTLKDFELHAFADLGLHGKGNVMNMMRSVNPESPLSDSMEFSTMWARAVELDVGESRMQFRDYPLPYSEIKEAYFWGYIAAAEHLAGDRSLRHEYIELPQPWGTFQINRNMCPLKFYYDLQCEISQLTAIYGPCWEPVLSMISLCWNYINAPSRDPSPLLPFWDKIRLLLHGRFLMLCKKLTTSMLASPDPYNETELIDVLWENFGFEWVAGQFRVQSDVDAFIRTASKYDDSRLLHIPGLKWSITLNWNCTGVSSDHHSATPVAPSKLPEYSTNSEHDSYRAFRSQSLDVVMNIEVKSPPEFNLSSNDYPQMLIYANTVKWFDFMKNTMTMVNRPIKRGPLFGTPHIKKQQLSRHLKKLDLTASIPRCLMTYWMSFSPRSHGFRFFCDNLQFAWGTTLQITHNEASDGLLRRPSTTWKTRYFSVSVDNAQLQLYGANRQPEGGKVVLVHENDRAFFLGFSRLSYSRGYHPDDERHQSRLEDAALHDLTIQGLRASWTVDNRDTCLAIMEGLQKAYLLKKVLSTDAMKILEFSQSQENIGSGRQVPVTRMTSNEEVEKSPSRTRTGSTDPNMRPPLHPTISSNFDDGGASSLLWKLVGSMSDQVVAYSENTLERPDDALNGVALSKKNDVIENRWHIELLHSQVMLIGCEKEGFVLMTADNATISNKVHTPVWRNAQLLLKKSWTAILSGMQYFAPLIIEKGVINREHFRFVSRKIIQKQADDATRNDKISSYRSSGEAVGGIVVDDEDDSGLNGSKGYQLQRVGGRCSCQMFFITFSDILNIEKFEKLVIPKMNESSDDVLEKREDVDCFTLKHNMLEVSTNSEQYQILLDIVNHLVLFVDPKKKQAEENRRRLWFKLAKISKEEVRASIERMQSDLREIVAIIRSLERQAFFLNRQQNAGTAQMVAEGETLKTEIEDAKAKQLRLIDELAMTISCFKEREMEEKSELHRLAALQHDDEQALIARRFEVCFEDCSWRLTENDGQISINEMQIRNFLYTRTARIDNSGEHLLEVGTVKVDNLIPDSKYREALARLPNFQGGTSEKTPALRIICRELAPVGGICVKEHFEVNIVPMQAQITYKFFTKMMAFFFPGRNIDKEDQQNLDKTEEAQQPHSGSFSLTRRLRGAMNSSLRSKTNPMTEVHSDEIDKMKERAEKNNVFVYIIIPQVTFIISYKGNKEKNIEDVDRFTFTFPICQYHDRQWTWLDLALAIKQRCRRLLLQQFMTQKFLRSRITGIDRMPGGVEPIDEEEKKRIALGKPITHEEKSKKKLKN